MVLYTLAQQAWHRVDTQHTCPKPSRPRVVGMRLRPNPRLGAASALPASAPRAAPLAAGRPSPHPLPRTASQPALLTALQRPRSHRKHPTAPRRRPAERLGCWLSGEGF